MRDGAELWWEGSRKKGQRELNSLEEETSPACRGSATCTCPACCFDGLVSPRVKSEDRDDGPSGHRDTSLHPVAGHSAQMAHDLSKVRVRGSHLAMDTVPRLGGPPWCCQGAPWTLQPTGTCPLGPGGHHPVEAHGNVPQRARPGAGLPTVCWVNTSKHCALPAGPGRMVPPGMQLANCPVASFRESRLPPLPSTSVGSTEPPARACAEGTALLHVGWPSYVR